MLLIGVIAAPADASEAWDKVVAAANQEGKIVCGCPPVPAVRKFLLTEFAKAHPKISLEYTAAPLPGFTAKVKAERAAGQYLWDVYFWGPGPEIYNLANEGVFEPVGPALLLPEVADPKVWGGWDQTYLDRAQKYVFAFWSELSSVAINAKTIPAAEMKEFKNLLDPKYKDKIVWWDPRAGGGGSNAAAFIHQRYGEEVFKTIFVDQNPILVPNSTDVAERMVRGTHPIGLGGDLTDVLKRYVDAGMNIDIRFLSRSPDWSWQSVGYGTVTLFNRAPNPNAAKVFLNWLLSRDVQASLADTLKRNSRRADVPPSKEETMPIQGERYFFTQSEQAVVEFRQKVIDLAKQLRPR